MNAYRELGLAEDATYDEIMDAFMSLSETYADDPGKLLQRARSKHTSERSTQTEGHVILRARWPSRARRTSPTSGSVPAQDAAAACAQ